MTTRFRSGSIAVYPREASRGLFRAPTRCFLAVVVMAVAAISFAPTPSHAQRNLTTVFESDPHEKSAWLQLYEAVCSDNPECILATLSCSERGQFEFDMNGFSDEDVGNWLLLNGGVLTLKNGSNTLPLLPTAIEASEMIGGWSISFLPTESWENWLAEYRADLDITISNIQGDLIVPKGEGDLRDLTDFIEFCRSTLRG